jgi:hypothetical protein
MEIMTCAEFQKVLPYIIDTGGNPEQQEHLRECSACSELVSDLQYIADQAKLLVPMIEPSPRVWKEIQTSLKDEGLVRPKRARGKLLGLKGASRASPNRNLPIALMLLSLGLASYWSRLQHKPNAPVPTAASMAVAPPAASNNDQQFLAAMTTRRPKKRASYAAGVRAMNNYISDARRFAEQNPSDLDAQQYLQRAYRQKAVLYGLGEQRPLE